MRIRRLGWAGLEVTAAGGSLVIDYVQDASPLLNAFLSEGKPVPPASVPATAALVTHLHEDHTDVAAITHAVGEEGLVLRPAPFVGSEEEGVFTTENERKLAESRLNARIVAEWESVDVGPFTVTAVPAVDGLGDPQINWVVEADGYRIFHGGDTMFHGYWWLISKRVGTIDLAALPVNGAVVDAPHLQPPSTLPADMTPREAVEVARVLEATVLLPTHFGVVWPEGYVEDSDPVANAKRIASERGQRIVTLEAGETLDLATIR